MNKKLFSLLRYRIASDSRFRKALQEEVSRYERGEDVPLEKLPEEFQEMNENPPESVLRVRKKMKKKSKDFSLERSRRFF